MYVGLVHLEIVGLTIFKSWKKLLICDLGFLKNLDAVLLIMNTEY